VSAVVRVDINALGEVIPRDWSVEPAHESCAAFTLDRCRFVGYGETEGEALANAVSLWGSTVDGEWKAYTGQG
jgi:hypothetical protein